MQFKELLEANFITHKKVDFYCSQLHITPKKLNASTSTILGRSPKRIINDRIILEAKRLLVHTTNNSKEISYSLGFQEPTNFIKFFKKNLNTTPLAFREKHNKE
nr:helix-turn-helix domain-containing protein [Polaribacter porphyrae]